MICVLSVIPITFVIFNILYKSSHLLNVWRIRIKLPPLNSAPH